MRRLCPLCGAKLYAEDVVCRQCGTPLGAAELESGAAAADGSGVSKLPLTAPTVAAEHDAGATAWRDAEGDAADEAIAPDDSAAFEEPLAPSAGRTPTDPGLELDEGTSSDADFMTPPGFDAPSVAFDDDSDPPRRGVAIVVALAGVVVVASVGGWWVLQGRSDRGVAEAAVENGESPRLAKEDPEAEAGPSPSEPGCTELEALAGQWELTTEVTTSTHPAQLGIHGFFSMSVDVEGCTATAELVKTGYTGRWYDDAHVQRGKAELTAGPHFGFAGAFDLRDGSGRGGKQDVVLTVHEHRLAGTYRMPGRTGFLEGARDPGRKILPVLASQPCIARCAVACDLFRRSAEDTSARDALDKCNTTCSAGNAPICGDAQALPEHFLVAVDGPADTLAAACNLGGRKGCKTDLKIKKKPTPQFDGRESEGVWKMALFAAVGRDLHLGLRTRAGWFAAGPILALDGAELTRARLFVRELGSDREERYVVGEVETAGGVASFACFVDGDAPRCAALPARASAVGPLPSRTIAIASKAGDLEPGIYTW